MSEVEELEARVRKLPSEALAKFRLWFYEFEGELLEQETGGEAPELDNARLLELADKKPAPKQWLEGDEERPF